MIPNDLENIPASDRSPKASDRFSESESMIAELREHAEACDILSRKSARLAAKENALRSPVTFFSIEIVEGK